MNRLAFRILGAVVFLLSFGAACGASEPEVVTYADEPAGAVLRSATTQMQFYGNRPELDIAAEIGANSDVFSALLYTGQSVSLDPEPKPMADLLVLEQAYESDDAFTVWRLDDGSATIWSNASTDALTIMPTEGVPNWLRTGCKVAVGSPGVLDPVAHLLTDAITLNLDGALTDRVSALGAEMSLLTGADADSYVRDLAASDRDAMLAALTPERDAFSAQFAPSFQSTAAIVFDHTVFNCQIVPPSGEPCEDCSGCPGVLGCRPPRDH